MNTKAIVIMMLMLMLITCAAQAANVGINAGDDQERTLPQAVASVLLNSTIVDPCTLEDYTYEWRGDWVTIDSNTIDDPNVTFEAPGTYELEVRLLGTNGTDVTDTVKIKVLTARITVDTGGDDNTTRRQLWDTHTTTGEFVGVQLNSSIHDQWDEGENYTVTWSGDHDLIDDDSILNPIVHYDEISFVEWDGTETPWRTTVKLDGDLTVEPVDSKDTVKVIVVKPRSAAGPYRGAHHSVVATTGLQLQANIYDPYDGIAGTEEYTYFWTSVPVWDTIDSVNGSADANDAIVTFDAVGEYELTLATTGSIYGGTYGLFDNDIVMCYSTTDANWIGASGTWDPTANWHITETPATYHTVNLGNETATVAYDPPTIIEIDTHAFAYDIRLAKDPCYPYILNLTSDANLVVTNDFIIGDDGIGTFSSLTTTNVIIGDDLEIGDNGSGTFTMVGGNTGSLFSLKVGDDIRVSKDDGGTGIMNLNIWSAQCDGLYIASTEADTSGTGVGTVTLTNTFFHVNNDRVHIGNDGDGTLTLEGVTQLYGIRSGVEVGTDTGGVGRLILGRDDLEPGGAGDDTALLEIANGDLRLGDSGTGIGTLVMWDSTEIDIQDGSGDIEIYSGSSITMHDDSYIYVEDDINNRGATFDLRDNAKLEVDSDFDMPQGTFDMTGNSRMSTKNHLSMANDVGTTGTITMSGTSEFNITAKSSYDFKFGKRGTGSLDLSNSAKFYCKHVEMARDKYGTGGVKGLATIDLRDYALLNTTENGDGDIFMADDGDAYITMTGHSVIECKHVKMANEVDDEATINMTDFAVFNMVHGKDGDFTPMANYGKAYLIMDEDSILLCKHLQMADEIDSIANITLTDRAIISLSGTEKLDDDPTLYPGMLPATRALIEANSSRGDGDLETNAGAATITLSDNTIIFSKHIVFGDNEDGAFSVNKLTLTDNASINAILNDYGDLKCKRGTTEIKMGVPEEVSPNTTTISVKHVELGGSSGGIATLTMIGDANFLAKKGDFEIGEDGTGVVTMSGTSMLKCEYMLIATKNGSAGTLTMNQGTTLTVDKHFKVASGDAGSNKGNDAVAVVNITGATIYIDADDNPTRDFYAGVYGDATVNITNTTVSIIDDMKLSSGSDDGAGRVVMTLDNTNIVLKDDLLMSCDGYDSHDSYADLTIKNGTFDVNDDFKMASEFKGGHAVLTIDNATLTVQNNFNFAGNSGIAEVELKSGTIDTNDLFMPYHDEGTATMILGIATDGQAQHTAVFEVTDETDFSQRNEDDYIDFQCGGLLKLRKDDFPDSAIDALIAERFFRTTYNATTLYTVTPDVEENYVVVYSYDGSKYQEIEVAIVQQPVCDDPPARDLTGDCEVDLDDFAIMARTWLDDTLL